MSYIRRLKAFAMEFFAQYPAVLSGYIIYAYLFVSILRLFVKVRYHGGTLSDAYDIFSALPFMWLLAVALVKVIDFRTRLHESEKQRLMREREFHVKVDQLSTMHEVVKGLQHQVNNPLAIISLSIGRAKRATVNNPEALVRIQAIEEAAAQIDVALQKLAEAVRYEAQRVDEVVGAIAAVPGDHPSSGPLKVKGQE